MSQKRIFMSAGDDSGDLHAASLMRAVKRQGATPEFVGLGLRRMLAEGLQPIEREHAGGSAMWFHNILRLGHFRRRIDLCRRTFREGGIDLVVLVDFGGFNLYVARAATRAGIPVLYYIPPQVWAHASYRLKKIRKWVTRALVIYPFEPELYRRYGVEAEYVGHPLFDLVAQSPPSPEAVGELRGALGERIVGLFPGSRGQEIRKTMPVLVKACARIQERLPEVRFAAVCPNKVRPAVEELLGRSGLSVSCLDVQPTVLAKASELCITKSGTVTLEIASQLTPMVIFYRVGPIFYFMGSGVATAPYLGLINNLAGKAVCPERPMWSPRANWVYEQSMAFLTDRDRRERCRREMAAVLSKVSRPGASERAAEVAIEMMGGSP